MFRDYEKQRDLNFRKEYFLKNDFKNLSVIDIGCNTGQLCRYAADLGATNILGIDYDDTAISNARKLSDKYKNIIYCTDDIDNYLFYTNLPNFDTGLFMSVIGTQELDNRYGILAKFSSKILKTMYIEGHHKVFRKVELLNALLKYTTFTSIEYLGITYDNETFKKDNLSRDMFRCSRKIYTENETLTKFIELLNNENKLIAFQGHSGTGKSTFKKKLIEYLHYNTNYKFDLKSILNLGYIISEDKSICIIDDIDYADINKLKTIHKFIIYFDYKVIEYTKNYNVDTLFIMNYDINTRFKNRPESVFMSCRTPDITNFNINNIYHIEPYNMSEKSMI